MGRFRVDNQADSDLRGIVDFIDEHSEAQGNLVRNAFFRTFEILADFPELAPKSYDYPGARRHTGSGKIQKYFIYYWIHEGEIEILRVIHSARDQGKAIIDSES